MFKGKDEETFPYNNLLFYPFIKFNFKNTAIGLQFKQVYGSIHLDCTFEEHST